MNGYQIECRCRLRGELGAMLHGLPRAARSRAVAVLLGSVGEGVDIAALLESREELRRVGILLNQSLWATHCQTGDANDLTDRVTLAVSIIDEICGKQKKGIECVR